MKVKLEMYESRFIFYNPRYNTVVEFLRDFKDMLKKLEIEEEVEIYPLSKSEHREDYIVQLRRSRMKFNISLILHKLELPLLYVDVPVLFKWNYLHRKPFLKILLKILRELKFELKEVLIMKKLKLE